MQAIEPIIRATWGPAQTWRYAFALMLTAAFLTACAQAGVELGIEEAEDKTIRIGVPDSKEPLRVSLRPVKSSFKVGEPIEFEIHGNKTFFLYLYSFDEKNDEVILLIPTREGQKHNKYPANRTLRVPNKGEIELIADGTSSRERLVMVASTEYLPVESKWYRKGADYYVGKVPEFEKKFSSKRIRVRGPDKTRDDKVLVQTVMVRIDGANNGGPAASASHVWLTTKGNRQDYTIGDPIEAVFGAGHDGWIHLYVVEPPNGQYHRLESYPVVEGRAYTTKAIAADPAGEHALVAVYSSSEDDASLGTKTKRVVLLEDEDKPTSQMAVYRFRISK
jgi:hypothetical protein